jgi:hypothetical protein
MDFLKNLLASKTIQGIISTVGGALVLFADSSYPQYTVPIKTCAAALISGGAVHAVHGRIVAQGPITSSPQRSSSPADLPGGQH